MSLVESTATTPPLLGLAGWDSEPWCDAYFPADLPDDWRFSYLANEVDCVLLRPGQWYLGLSAETTDRLSNALAEAPVDLSFLLAVAPEQPPPRSALERFAAFDVGLLVDQPLALADLWPQWRRTAPGRWTGEDRTEVRVWQVESIDLRAWRQDAAALPPTLRALILSGPAASPGRVTELRTMLQLLGLA
jgi:hypothetical protein